MHEFSTNELCPNNFLVWGVNIFLQQGYPINRDLIIRAFDVLFKVWL
jgi:hypothetical protein